MIITRQLITQAYYLAGIIWIDGEIPTGQQIDTGLNMLNGIISETAMDAILILYFTQQNFTAIVGQETYVIPNLIELSTLTFSQQDVRYQMSRQSINQYNGISRVNNLNSLPTHYYVQRQLNASKIFVYPFPNLPYEFQITGKFMNSQVTLDEVIDNVYDGFYCKWLQYRLAYELCQLYEKEMNTNTKTELDNLERRLNKTVGTDLSINKFNFIDRIPYKDPYLQANFPSAWYP
jgi:hypothetical protein